MMPGKGYAPDPDDLVARNGELVRRIAWHFHERIGRRVEIGDLLQAGYLGLVDASRRYAPQRDVAFAAYAAIRIRGSIVDHLRTASSVCRATMAKRTAVQATTQALAQRLGRTPTDAELAAEMSMSPDELGQWQARIAASSTASLSDIYTDQSLAFMDQAPSAEEDVHRSQLRGLLRRSLDVLGEREALVLQLYYVEELNIYEVADILGVTTGRVSQIKKAAIGRLRKRMGDLMGEPVTA